MKKKKKYPISTKKLDALRESIKDRPFWINLLKGKPKKKGGSHEISRGQNM